MELTYRNLIKPIPAKYSLSSVTLAPALKTCDFCRVAVPDRAKAKRNVIETPFERIDTYPEFQALKSSARDGCGYVSHYLWHRDDLALTPIFCSLCWIIRKHMRSSWAVRPMEEWGVGPLDENDDLSSDLLHTRWDGKVRFFNLKFTFNPLLDGGGAAEDESACFKQEAGMVTAMTLEFGPVTPDAAEDGSYLHGEISQILGFKVFDSVGSCDALYAGLRWKLITNRSQCPGHKVSADAPRRVHLVGSKYQDDAVMDQGMRVTSHSVPSPIADCLAPDAPSRYRAQRRAAPSRHRDRRHVDQGRCVCCFESHVGRYPRSASPADYGLQPQRD